MSHYARLVAPLTARTRITQERVDLPVDTEIKRVTVAESGFHFEARCMFGAVTPIPAWVALEVDDDLPAFTDKGRAHRARKVHATLKPGRPLSGEEHAVKPVAVRVSEAQRKWVDKRAARKELTVSEYVRSLLEADGMPR